MKKMNHQKVYEAIIIKAKSENRQKLKKTDTNYVYYENHHILPKCLGGNNEKDNLVLLTAREHYVCHKLLTYIYKENRKLANAFHLMTFNKKDNYHISLRDYMYAKLLKTNTYVSKETRRKLGLVAKRRRYTPLSEETKEKIRISNRGKKQTQETIEKRIKTKRKNNSFKISEETKEKLRISNIGKHDHSGKNNPMYKNRHTTDAKHKMGLSHLKTHNINLSKEIIIEIKTNYKIISMIEITKKYNIPYNTVRHICKGKYDWLLINL